MKVKGWVKETRPCEECRHIQHIGKVCVCSKLFVAVVPDLYTLYPEGEETCFEYKEVLNEA